MPRGTIKTYGNAIGEWEWDSFLGAARGAGNSTSHLRNHRAGISVSRGPSRDKTVLVPRQPHCLSLIPKSFALPWLKGSIAILLNHISPEPRTSTQWAANRWQKSHLHLRKPRCWAAWDETWTGHTDAKLLGRAGEWSRTAVSSQSMAIKRAPVQIDRELSWALLVWEIIAPTNDASNVTVAQHAASLKTLPTYSNRSDKAPYLLYRVIKHHVFARAADSSSGTNDLPGLGNIFLGLRRPQTFEWRYNNLSGMNSEDRKREGTIPGRNKLERPHLPPCPGRRLLTTPSYLFGPIPRWACLTPLFPPLCLLRRCSVIAAVPDLWEFLKRICGRSVGRAEELSRSFLALLPLLLREAFPNVLLPTRRAKSTSTPETSTGACVQCETLMEFKVQFFCLLLKALWLQINSKIINLAQPVTSAHLDCRAPLLLRSLFRLDSKRGRAEIPH
ncbi:uncharacterized protein CLUP02_04540 [Colletotrichum lupini]|uniref:Uncharacterized protein n=1 Tax=Colletotrichum lupini TaxID=145971 RepID=A0A9Q8SLI6_9PEZI|nr:uncharacterized protein CLUP02_04540 [Colletotrichum lupini]UQC79061.1 hypothetical protein CLUP02_04540 [Colletotrichum lupini]